MWTRSWSTPLRGTARSCSSTASWWTSRSAQKPDTLEYAFQVQNKGQIVNARYTGVVPDTFKDGSEVVIKGHLVGDRFKVEPNGVMAKCPSKYEAAPPRRSGI